MADNFITKILSSICGQPINSFGDFTDFIKSIFSGNGFLSGLGSFFGGDSFIGRLISTEEPASQVDSDLETNSITNLFALATDISNLDSEFGKQLETFAEKIEEDLKSGELDLTSAESRINGKMTSLTSTFTNEVLTSDDENLAYNKLKTVFNNDALNNVDKITEILSIQKGLQQANQYIAENTPTVDNTTVVDTPTAD